MLHIKIKFIILILIFIFCVQVFSEDAETATKFYQEGISLYQASEFEAAIESLLKAAKIDQKLGPKHSEQLENDFVYIAYCYWYLEDFNNVLKYYKNALSVAEDNQHQEGIAFHLNNIAGTYYSLYQFDSAVTYYKKLSDFYKKLSDKKNQAICLSTIAMCYQAMYDFENAVYFGNLGLSIYQEEGLKNEYVTYLTTVGECLAALYRYEEVVELYNNGVVLAGKLGMKDYEAIYSLNHGNYLINLAEYEKAFQVLQKAEKLYRELESRSGIAEVKRRQGYIYYLQTDFENSLKYYSESYEIFKEINDSVNQVNLLENLAETALIFGRYQDAVDYYLLALNLDKLTENAQAETDHLNNIGKIYSDWGKFEPALSYFEKAYNNALTHGFEDQLSVYLNNMGSVYLEWGDYTKAAENIKQALDIAVKQDMKKDILTYLNNLGNVFDAVGEFDKAIENYEQALTLAKEHGTAEDFSIILNNIGLVYHSWGKYDSALAYMEQALEYDKKTGNKALIASRYGNIGLVYNTQDDYENALKYFTIALEMATELENQALIGLYLNNLGTVYHSQNNYDKALVNYEKSHEIALQTGQLEKITSSLSNIGLLYKDWEKYEKALEYYKKAISLAEDAGMQEELTTYYTNAGSAYWHLEQYDEAINYLNKSIAILEKLRLTAPDAVRRDFLASQIYNYEWLISTYIRSGKPVEAFNTIELVTGKYLVDQLGQKLMKQASDFTDYITYYTTIPKDTAVIAFANTGWDTCVQIFLDGTYMTGYELNLPTFISSLDKLDHTYALNKLQNLRGLSIGKKITDQDKLDFSQLINYYRLLLTAPNARKSVITELEYLGRKFYDIFIKDIEEDISSKKNLVILPSGVLSFLPFETLVMPDGRYLVEKYNIKYIQSFTVSNIIKSRKYKADRQPLLAIGGAVYDVKTYEAKMIESEKQLLSLKKESSLYVSRGAKVDELYPKLGLLNWENLPGTLTEVTKIHEIVPGSKILTGKDASESYIKNLSVNNNLTQYRVLHFATHGIVVPEIPELSSVVLTLSEDINTEEDGYLCMNEIADLDLNADFVNLSACETGLGKIYGGEGVVGLTQAFLIAGANGLSVSLWQVADESTMKFMIGVYNLVQELGISYDQAMTLMKREFIAGDYAHPFYWAPFIYYGN